MKSIIVSFAHLFNNIHVYKYDTSGNAIEKINVPLVFGPRSKIYDDRAENYYTDYTGEVHGDPYWMKTPRLEFDLNGIVYDASRATSTNNWRYFYNDDEIIESVDKSLYKVISDYQPAPYNVQFKVSLVADSFDHAFQIIENILPYFNPSLNLRVKEFSFLNIERDLQLDLDGISPDISGDMSETDRRQTNFTMNFTVKAWMYRPFVGSSVIKYINSKYMIQTDTSLTIKDSFYTSGYATSGGVVIETSAIPPISAYSLSGDIIDTDKELVWYESRS